MKAGTKLTYLMRATLEPQIETVDQGFLALAATTVEMAVRERDLRFLRHPGATELVGLISACSGVPLHVDCFIRRALAA